MYVAIYVHIFIKMLQLEIYIFVYKLHPNVVINLYLYVWSFF